MSGLLPIVEQLADCKTHAERAEWLLCSPMQVLDRENGSIRLILREAGFLAGVDYLDAEMAAMRSVRVANGSRTESVRFMVAKAAMHMREHAGMPLASVASLLFEEPAIMLNSPPCVHFTKPKEV
ncbi:hypothetical protein BJ928_107139 [Rhizobium sp. WW_1]|nr:hypothetical protein BJ928_107139 [Rhizobium sp. WW_1]